MKNLVPLLMFLIVLASCSKDDSTNPIIIPNDTIVPIANFSYTLLGEYPPLEVKFVNSSLLASNYSWTFGDGGTSTEKDPTHLYTNSGSFAVKLTAHNADTLSYKTKTVTIPELPTKVFLKSLTMDSLKFTDFFGMPWDTQNGPDVFFQIEITNPNIEMIYKSAIISDIEEGNMPVVWSYDAPYIELTEVGTNFQFIFAEDDGVNYTAMTDPVVYNFASISGYPSTVQLSSSVGGVTFTLELVWK